MRDLRLVGFFFFFFNLADNGEPPKAYKHFLIASLSRFLCLLENTNSSENIHEGAGVGHR